MSRFGLRSASESLKLLDDKPNRRKTCNPVSISMKRNALSKDIKHVTNIKEENIVDDIKIEIDDGDKVSEIADAPPRDNVNDGDDDDDEDDDAPVEAGNGDICFRQHISPTTSFKASLICSLPLERIHDVLQKLNLSNNPKQINNKDMDDIDESFDNDDDEEEDNNLSKQSTSAVKSLCLYCDKKFSSQKMQLKHVEKFHCLQQDRRCSGRNSQMQQTQTPKKRKSTTGSQNFVGCSYCPKNKGQSQSVILPASELNALFLHLADSHSDKYFGCKMCVLRFQNVSKLSKHMEVVHKSLSFAFDESSSKSKDNDTDSQMLSDKSLISERSKFSMRRQQRSQKTAGASSSANSTTVVQNTVQCATSIVSNSSIIGAEEPILSRLGLTQNRLPNNRKGVRLRREKLLSEILLKSEQINQPPTNYTNTATTSSAALNTATCSPKLRGKAIKAVGGSSADTTTDVIFRVPTRNDILSCVFDDNFYKEVVANVRNNLLFHLDGKIMGNSLESLESAVMRHSMQPQIRSTLVRSPIVITTDSEIHAATSLAAITAFPTLLTAEQFGGEGHSSKIRRPHTKNSWKWKWDSVKKFKFVNEGGKIVKKMKHPMLGLRDLSKLDMWTQLTMRQKHEQQTQYPTQANDDSETWNASEISNDPSREEKQRLNDQLNMILDTRLLPHIILEQNEQAIIKLENDEFGIAPSQSLNEDCSDNFMEQTFADESFLSMLNLLPSSDSQKCRSRLVLSGEWARPRCYLCMCCGAKFEKLKSLEEHKMFRHSQILSTHYEVVGRELLNGNLLRHLFLPKKALSRYANDMGSNQVYSGAARRLFWHKNETISREITNNEESSDSLQSMLNSCTTNTLSIKNSSSTEDCDVVDTKMATVASLGLMATTAVVSPTHSIQSCSSSSSSVTKSKAQSRTPTLSGIVSAHGSGGSIYGGNGCSKCGRKCNGILDLYRHMLDCSGDYVWSLAKKRKYRYYCGSKKRRPCNKHSILELRKAKNASKPASTAKSPPTAPTESTEEAGGTSANFTTKTKTSPRPRPSDAESIKKMLENLPPKRVCKKIFPTISKTKKTIKNMKPKLLAKHKIYNKLRNTRVRQISQAAKILSKKKTQLQKSKRMTTRSAVATSENRNENISKKQTVAKNVTEKVAATKAKPTEKSLISGNDNQSELVIKKEDLMDLPSSKSTITATATSISSAETSENTTNHEVARDVLESNSGNLSEKSNRNTYKQKDDPTLGNVDQVDASASASTSTSISQHLAGESDKSPNQTEQLSDANKQTDIVSMTQLNPANFTENERQMPNNKNIKRSKRISDCIAMLTGKLEQKLKTEQKTSFPSGGERSLANNISQRSEQNTRHAPSLPLAQNVQERNEISKNFTNVSEDLEVIDNIATAKKIPKRKTISRRIIKTDDGPSPSKSIETNVDSSSNLQKTTETTLNTSLLIKDKTPASVSAEKLNISGQIKPTKIVGKPATNPEICIFNAVDVKQTKSIPTATLLVPPITAAMPLNNQHLMPNVPMYIPVENFCAPHLPAPLPSLPIPLSVPAPPLQPAPIPTPIENTIQPSTVIHTGPAPTAIGIISPPTAIPLITAVPPAHLTASNSMALPVGTFSVPTASEPLNLSNSAKNIHKQSQDLSFSGRQKVGVMPARRQTICGFEARNFIMFDEMEPLDLSNKSRQEKVSRSPIVQVQPLTQSPLSTVLQTKPIELSPALLPPQLPSLPLTTTTMPTSVDGATLLPAPPLTSEALLNKQFYSNLDLLRIPQVRNPVAGQGNTVSETPPLPLSLTQAHQPPAQPPPILTPQPLLVVNPAPIPVATSKVAPKKRNKPSVITNQINAECNQIANNVSSKQAVSSKDQMIATSKKDSSSKAKGPLRMDEEVINHIDDAINSVINAVKASLDNEEAERSQALFTSSQPTAATSLKTTDDVNVTKESVGEFKFLTAARRNMRSKTLDCRPAALNRTHVQNSPSLSTEGTHPNVAVNAKAPHQQIISVRNIETLMIPVTDSNNTSTYGPTTLVSSSNTKSMSVTSSIAKPETEKSNATMVIKEIQKTNTCESQAASHVTEVSASKVQNEVPKPAPEPELDFEVVSPKVQPIISQQSSSLDKNNTSEGGGRTTALAVLSDINMDKNVLATTTANINTNLDVEQMSNNNNTSSGFHSSAQSDQQTSVMSTNTTASTTIPVIDTKKKQRRRRKNELAAIVADQLLESFKLDKARRDNLKKLENLAYEKSEDLLLTGMLLMSSTKRNVASSAPTTTSSTTTAAAAAPPDNENILKRASKQHQHIESSKVNDTHSSVNLDEQNPGNNIKNLVAESTEIGDNKKNTKRRQCRRRGKTLDNENISKLKSSLESFSIDIERQLTEYEAKNVNVFKNAISSSDVGKSQMNNKSQTSLNSKSTVILRPSILSLTLEAGAVHQDNQQPVKSSTAITDANKTVISSRDPRLNKNIHKEGEKSSTVVSDNNAKEQAPPQKSPEVIGDLDEDNYLTEIAKNVNEKIMSTENEEFAFKDDGFEMANDMDMGIDDSNSKYSRPPTSMSVRSAPNFNDDRSNFGSICDENTNTEVMDMDLDDEMSVYTSYSQDLGRGRGRRRRRRRSILLTRKPKKRASSRDMSGEKIECILCKKVFYSANSLTKHNMTLAHVSKVSEQEYLLSKSITNSSLSIDNNQKHGTLGPYARRSTRRATISEPPMHMQSNSMDDLRPTHPPTTTPIQLASSIQPLPLPQTDQTPLNAHPTNHETASSKPEETPAPLSQQLQSDNNFEPLKTFNQTHLLKDVPVNDYDGNNGNIVNPAFNGNSRLNLNPDERLFFECCNILKSAETPRHNNVIVPEVVEECNNIHTNYNAYTYRQEEKSMAAPANNSDCLRDRQLVNIGNVERSDMPHNVPHITTNSNVVHPNTQQPHMEQNTIFRDPSQNVPSNYNNRSFQENRNVRSPTYSAISHLSAVTNTTSRFKTKAAMKGYENVNIDMVQQQESKSRTICKLTELAEIALGNEDKPSTHSFSPIQRSNTPTRPSAQNIPSATKADVAALDGTQRLKSVAAAAAATDYATLLAIENPKESNVPLVSRNDRTKNNETRSSTSSKTIMHSSIIKAAVQEHQKTPSCNKIIIPDRPFKNIGLEEKETITFQKPKTPAVHLLTEDNNSVSTGSFSDRDDYDFGSLSCDEEASVRESNEKNPRNNATDSSSESSRATAKTFENKSLIMGRIFKNVSTKAAVKNNVAPVVKVKSVGVQKDQVPTPKADLNQLFDELRGNSGVEHNLNERAAANTGTIERTPTTVVNSRVNHKQHQRDMLKHIIPSASPPAVVSSTTATPSTSARKAKGRESRAKPKTTPKTSKDISKLQTELGMSPDEIKQLIDEGQRKSKRRCATNRPKKLVEMWSSDEYEEFLSTKDIIALIEEKEQQEEKRKKRKNSINISSNNSEVAKEKDIADVTSSTKDNKRRNNRKVNTSLDFPEDHGTVETKSSKAKRSGKEDLVSTTGLPIVENISTANSGKEKRSTAKGKSKAKQQSQKTVKTPKSKKEPKSKVCRKPVEDNDYEEFDANNSDFGDDDYLIADLIKNKKSSAKAKSSKATVISAPTVTSTAKSSKASAKVTAQPSRKRSTNNSGNYTNVLAATESAKGQKQTASATVKNKRKNQTNQSPPRRKRLATEKLYYWSSSSDEEFGRISNNAKDNSVVPNSDGGGGAVGASAVVGAGSGTGGAGGCGGEQYQKHGWIVGDSHKKLVTLLAIAKGNKKVDSNCGVKKNVPKKRN